MSNKNIKLPKFNKRSAYYTGASNLQSKDPLTRAYSCADKVIKGTLAVLTALVIFGSVITGEVYCCIDNPYLAAENNVKENYYDWEWDIIQNGGWYTDADLGGTRYATGLACAYSRMTTGELVPLEVGLTGKVDAYLSKFKLGELKEEDVYYMVSDGLLNQYCEKTGMTGKEYPTDITYRNKLVNIWLSNGYMTEYVEQFKELGCLNKDYTLPKGTKDRDVKLKEAVKKKKLFTAIEAYEFTK